MLSCPLRVPLAPDCGFQYSQEQQRPVQLTLSVCAAAARASWKSGPVPRVFTDKKTRPLVDTEKSLGAHKDYYFCPSSGPVDRHGELCQVSLTTRLHRAAARGRDPWDMERTIKGQALSVPLPKRVQWGKRGKAGA